ncbi:NAD(P)-dependent oxidoreductase [Streptomyces sp. NPDC058718]|uniref:NAD(P)-dependent oxidoreductase n=1 Tax=Streptomyces sp. NPDC058718 TaxID=3346610 RepID=UPI0036CDD973
MNTASERTEAAQPAVTVLGLGEMGSAIAGAFLDGGHPTTVWNRTPEKADPLVARGAERSATVRDAVAAGPLVVVSVKGNATARAMLESAGDALSGRSVLNLTDGTSAEARAVAEWVTDQGAQYLHGQIMTIAPGLGAAETVIFYGGSDTVFHHFAPALQLLGGRGTLISADAGVPALYGMAVHGTMWGALNGFLHAAALLSSEGIEVKRFLDDAGPSVAGLLASLPVIADEVDRGEYATPYGALHHHRPSIEDLIRESGARNIDVDFPAYTLGLVNKALEDGHADDSYSRLVEHFRKQ